MLSSILKFSSVILVLSAIFFNSNIKDTYYRDYVGDSVVRIWNAEKTGGGTGFHVETDNDQIYILTNNHICEGADKDNNLLIEYKGQLIPKKIIERYEHHDLCLVEPIEEVTRGIEIASSDSAGENITVVGHPGLRDLTISHGEFIGYDEIKMMNMEVSEKECKGQWVINPILKAFFGIEGVCLETFQTSAISSPIYPGNSGSPVVNKYGNLVGVVFAGSEQINDGHMVPLSFVKDLIKGL